MVHIQVNCPYCQKSLMDEDRPIKEIPSISLLGKLPAELGGTEGTIRLSAYYGDYQVETSLVIPGQTIVQFRCPSCKRELDGSRLCDACRAPMIALEFPRGGRLQFCSRRGCKKHLIEFENPEADLDAFYREYLPYME